MSVGKTDGILPSSRCICLSLTSSYPSITFVSWCLLTRHLCSIPQYLYTWVICAIIPWCLDTPLASGCLGVWLIFCETWPPIPQYQCPSFGWRNGTGREGWLLPGDRVAPRVVVGVHACQVNHGDLCLYGTQCVACCSFLLSLVSLAFARGGDPRWLAIYATLFRIILLSLSGAMKKKTRNAIWTS